MGFLWLVLQVVGLPVESHVHRKQDGYHEVNFVKYSLFYCVMSRLIVKNLPKDIKEDRFRSLFSTKGEITDLRLCKTKDGQFRRFGFVGFKTKEEADNAIKYFNNSYIDTSKIQIEIARNLGEKSSSRPWSKYSKGSSAYEKIHHDKNEQTSDSNVNEDNLDKATNKGKKKKKKTASKEDNELEEDSEFQEFLLAHQSRNTKSMSGNENVTTKDNSTDETYRGKPKADSGYSKEMPSDEKQSDNELSSGKQFVKAIVFFVFFQP